VFVLNRSRLALGFAIVGVVLSSTIGVAGAASTTSWTQATTTSAPSARDDVAMVYDSRVGSVVLFGGYSPGCNSFCSDTWIWNGATWNQRATASSPPGRYGASIAYDPAANTVVLFGGYGLSGITADTWLFDQNGWSKAMPATSPPARGLAQMVYDPATGNSVLFGGNGFGPLQDTWTWKNGVWTQHFPVTSPSPRSGYGLAYDAASRKVVLFGGISPTAQYFNDTWTWDGVNWTQQTTPTSPPARFNAAMAYDNALRGTVLFGGLASQPGLVDLGDTWIWNGSAWRAVSPTTSPSARSDDRLVYDAASRTGVLFGGCANTNCATLLNDTWILR
jgi:hypothetical protein